jgi:hypothetical protein
VGLKYFITPPYTPHIGLRYVNPAKSKANTLAFDKEIVTVVKDYIISLKPKLVSIALPFTINDTQPFYWDKFKVIPNYTYRLALNKTPDELFNNLTSEKRKSVKRAEKDNLLITSTADYKTVTVVNNGSVGSDGGGIVVGSGDYYGGFTGPGDNNIVTNNIVFNNNLWGIIENGNTGTHSTYHNNLVVGHTTNWRLQNGLTHTGTVTANPAFVNYLANGTGDYHLAAGSPAINTGLNASYVPATDYDGVARPHGAAPDRGAYERSGR